MRAISPTAQVELLRREAYRHFLSGTEAGAKQAKVAIDQLLRLHPRSYAAFWLRGEILYRRGDKRAAEASFARAAEIVVGEEDSLLIQAKSPSERKQIAAAIADRLRQK